MYGTSDGRTSTTYLGSRSLLSSLNPRPTRAVTAEIITFRFFPYYGCFERKPTDLSQESHEVVLLFTLHLSISCWLDSKCCKLRATADYWSMQQGAGCSNASTFYLGLQYCFAEVTKNLQFRLHDVNQAYFNRIGSVRHQEVTSRHRPLSASDPHPVHPPLPLRFRQRLFDYIWRDPKFSSSVFQKTMETGQKSDTYRLHQRLSTFLSLFPTAVSSPEESEIASTMRNLLEKQCISVLPTLPLDSALSLADIWYLVSEIDFKVPCFHRHFVDRLMQDPSAITLPQAIQAFLYCAIYRKITVQGQDILRKILLSGSDLMSVNDLELIAFGAYVLKIPFRDNPQFLKRYEHRVMTLPCARVKALNKRLSSLCADRKYWKNGRSRFQCASVERTFLA